MRLILCAILFCTAVGLGGAAPKKADPDEKALAGTWVIQSAQDNGEQQATFKGVKLTFKGGDLEFQLPDGEKGKGAYKLDSSRKPKAIDLALVIGDFLITHEGLYTLKGDELVICQAAERGGKRPAKIDGSAGSKCWLWKLKRVK